MIPCVIVIVFLLSRFAINRSLDRADAIELKLYFQRWLEAGRPQGDNLKKFLHGRRPDILNTNISIFVDGVEYKTEFAVTKPKSGSLRTLFVTTSTNFIWLNKSGSKEIFLIDCNKTVPR